MNRPARAKAAQALRAPRMAEARYVRDLRGILRAVHGGTMRALEPETRHDGSTQGRILDLVSSKLVRFIRVQVGEAYDRMSAKVSKKHAVPSPALRVIGIHPDALLLPVIAQFRNENIALVENAAQDYAASVRAVLDDPSAWGVRVEDIADKIRAKDAIAAALEGRAAVSESRAELIARDQTLKLNGQLNATRQQAAGVTGYTWSTSRDERVRRPKPGKLGPDHFHLDGTRQTWGNPPITNTATGDTNEPGQDFQCRCIALPIIPEFEDH